MKTKEHYKNHLFDYYSWIYGGLKENIQKNKKFFQSHNIVSGELSTAIDLGAGSGFQSIALNEMGFNVYAIDFCKELLDEIICVNQNINIIEDDIMHFHSYKNITPQLIISMGDTLTHLTDIQSVEDLIENAYNELTDKGKIALSFRDLTFELKGRARFIPVKSDDNRIFTCFLEYRPDSVNVNDIIHEKIDGQWIQKISSYEKIKISEDIIKEILIDKGFEIEFFEKNNGIITIIGSKI